MSGLPERCCATCVSWSNTEPALATGLRRPDGADPAYGICRFNPPVVVAAYGIVASRFPEIHATRICDDWGYYEPDGGDDGETVVPFRSAA